MKKILIVVDMQNDFVDGALGTKEAEAIVDRVADKIRSFEGEIIVTQDTHGQNYLETAEGRKLPVPHCIRGTDGWQLNAKVLDALSGKHYRTLEKPTFAAIALPEEVEAIRGDDDMEAEFVGLCTDICVISNVLLLKAYYPEMRIAVDEACCAGVTPQSHTAALAAMKSCQIDIV